MELSQQSIHDVIHPTAAFVGATYAPAEPSPSNVEALSWQDSPLNPKNRIDSLDVPSNPLWKIDGCTAFGSQFYAVPLFLPSVPPMRIDFFIPEPAKLPAELRNLLDVDVTFHTRDASRISHLGITRHILRILQHWTLYDRAAKTIYQDVPFGSRIVLHNLPTRVDEAQITIARAHYLERQLLSVAALNKYWGDEIALPPTVELGKVQYVSQIHDSVCLVKIGDRTWIFKALTSCTKYLYHELRQLLRIPAHAGIVARPAHLITKTCSFGGKVAVVGFTLEYHTRGSLRDLLPYYRLHGMTSLRDETRWSLQLATALLHLRESTGIFYPDLRLDNIVLSDSHDVVMVDFEQRGVWCEFAAPEVNAIEYIRLLAVDEEIAPDVKEKYVSLLNDLLPDWESLGEGEDYDWPSNGYNVPWACLSPAEQEACEVYMLGRVLWCIFEANSAPQRAAVWLSYRWEPRDEFPLYNRTPQPMRDLIDRCTRGRQPGLSRLIVRERNQLVLRQLEKTGKSTAHQVQETARAWWSDEIQASESFLAARAEGLRNGTWNDNYYNRPSLKEVRDAIRDFQQTAGLAS
ncbi:hypothetical protein HJFPF1_00914 [Paramyrothecium foliicola]|nr:hypothetical protein HJFPF1_00914 [Paramyrothecium foliicola]